MKVNDAVSLTALRDAQAKTQLFIKNMQPPLKNMEEIRGYLDVSMQQFFLEYDAEDLVSEKGGKISNISIITFHKKSIFEWIMIV